MSFGLFVVPIHKYSMPWNPRASMRYSCIATYGLGLRNPARTSLSFLALVLRTGKQLRWMNGVELSRCLRVRGVTDCHTVGKCICFPVSPLPAILHSTKEVRLHLFGTVFPPFHPCWDLFQTLSCKVDAHRSRHTVGAICVLPSTETGGVVLWTLSRALMSSLRSTVWVPAI